MNKLETVQRINKWFREQEKIPGSKPLAKIQWQGTDACLDFHCECGSNLHFDEEFLYYILCGDCKNLYALGDVINVHKIPDEMKQFIMKELNYKTTNDPSK